MDDIQNPTGASTGAAGENASEPQVATQDSQETEQGQNTGQGSSSVDNPGETTSSAGQQPGGRPPSASAWQRQIEKALTKKLESMQSQLLDRLTEQMRSITPAQPAAAAAVSPPQSDTPEIDFNDLPNSINRLVEKRAQALLQKELPRQFESFKGTLKADSATQEARNYLLSQKDISSDEDKLAEIKEIMVKNYLVDALDRDPVGVTKHAVELWRKTRVNPNAPKPGELSTVAGAGPALNGSKQPVTADKYVELQKRLAKGGTVDEMEKLYTEIDALTK